MLEKYILGIDIGTGSTKAVAIGFNSKSLGVAQHHYQVNSPKPGYAEQDAAQIFNAFKQCIADITTRLGAPVAITLSSAMHSVIPVDANGNAMAGMITWADARAQHVAERILESGLGATIYSTSGTPIHAMTPLCKLIWLRENEPELFARTFKFISIKEYVWFRLFGQFQVDHSIASATGLFDIETFSWSQDACKLAGIDFDKLSALVNTDYHRSDVNPSLVSELKLNANTPIVVGASDGCCANLGSYVTTPDVAALTIGTSGAVRVTNATPIINAEAMIFNYVLNRETFVSGGAVNNGGGAVQWLIKTFLNQQPDVEAYKVFFSKVETIAAGSDGLLFLPYLNGERTPLWNTRAGGVFFNIRQHHQQSHFLRAGLEGICFALLDVLQTLEKSAQSINSIHISGGFINSPLWTQLLADITGKPLVIVQHDDASAIGAVMLGAKALNLEYDTKPPMDEQVVIKPDLVAHQLYTNRFKVFKKLYLQLKDLMDDKM